MLCIYCVWCVCVCVSVREMCLIYDGVSGNIGSSYLQSEDVKLTRIPYVLSTVQHSAVHYERTIEFNSRVQHIDCIVLQCFSKFCLHDVFGFVLSCLTLTCFVLFCFVYYCFPIFLIFVISSMTLTRFVSFLFF